MNCPNCQLKMKVSQRQGVKIDYCTRCRGIWLERGELDKIIQRTMSLAMPFPVPLEAGEVPGDFPVTNPARPKKGATESELTKFYFSELFEVE